MKIFNSKIVKITIIFFATTLLAFSCSTKNKNITQVEQVELAPPPREPWKPSAEKICVIFGYGYNNEDFLKTEIPHLEDFFGISNGTENSGIIIPLVYPDDFKIGNTGRISHLRSLLKDVKVAGIISIGAPEYTSNTLANLKDNMEEGKEYPIYTFFPQDDILAIEATSDFVLDKAIEQTENVAEIKEEIEQVGITGIEEIIDNAIDYIKDFPKPLKSNSELLTHVSNIVGQNHKIKRYVDPETGLSSINHFIIEDK